MNRTIKFRTWDRKAKQMIYLNAVAFYTKKCKMPQWKVPFEDCVGLNEDDEDVMQFTGLSDIENHEIYEGDILHFKDDAVRFFVVWDDDNACFYGRQLFIERKENFDDFQEFNFNEWGSSFPLSLGCLSEICSVIGNSFENPELLKS